MSVNTNNGTERQNESLKYQYLKDRNNNSLSGLIVTLIEEFLPDKYRRELPMWLANAENEIYLNKE